MPGIPSDFFITNYTGAGNLNYRIPMGWASFIEPTVGVIFVRTDHDMAILNLSHGELLRVQGGARLGSTWSWYGMSVLGTLKLLAYSNVYVEGITVLAPSLGGTGAGLAGVRPIKASCAARSRVLCSLDWDTGTRSVRRARCALATSTSRRAASLACAKRSNSAEQANTFGSVN